MRSVNVQVRTDGGTAERFRALLDRIAAAEDVTRGEALRELTDAVAGLDAATAGAVAVALRAVREDALANVSASELAAAAARRRMEPLVRLSGLFSAVAGLEGVAAEEGGSDRLTLANGDVAMVPDGWVVVGRDGVNRCRRLIAVEVVAPGLAERPVAILPSRDPAAALGPDMLESAAIAALQGVGREGLLEDWPLRVCLASRFSGPDPDALLCVVDDYEG